MIGRGEGQQGRVEERILGGITNSEELLKEII